MHQTTILLRPIITEKTTSLGSKNCVVFEVSTSANKYQIKSQVESNFNVTVIRVNTSIVPGKTKRVGRSKKTTRSTAWKKAIVQLKSGDKIDLFDTKEASK